MPKANNDLRLLAKGCGVPLWAIAEQRNISEQTLIRQWRKELPEEEKEIIRSIIKQLKAGESNGE